MSHANSPGVVLRVGVLFVGPEIQLLDMSAVDLFGMCTPAYLKHSQQPSELIAKSQDFEIIYIAEGGAGTHAKMTGGAKVLITHSFEDSGKLDYLVVPGSMSLTYQPTPAELDFIHKKFSEVRVLMPICTGVFPIVYSGVLKGRRATGPRMLLPLLKKIAPDVQWTEKRWEVDLEEKVWTSGIVSNGLDLVAAYIRKTFAPELAEFVCATADVGERGREYETGL
ncbi:hypothetical protein M0805_003997 [Coniferiporia weirii]|nr:hypothetical protein M0805_003997 [Coniferiporia weirii]